MDDQEGLVTSLSEDSPVVTISSPPDFHSTFEEDWRELKRGLGALLHWAAGRIINHNPFYVISTGLVLYGIRLAIQPTPEGTISLLGPLVLAVYAVLVAVAAFLVIRFGKVWDDARTILLIVVILFLALSMLFDELLMVRPAAGRWLLFSGLSFSMGLSIILLRVLRIRLGSYYMQAYLALLVLFFAYPAWLTILARGHDAWGAAWAVGAFPSVCGLAFLSLLPVVRRGTSSIEGNGTPWPWPLFPGSFFFLLGVGVVPQVLLFSVGFDTAAAGGIVFRTDFSRPLRSRRTCFFEIASIRQSTPGKIHGAVPVAMLFGITNWERMNSTTSEFHEQIITRLGSPLFLTVWSMIAFHVWACLRGSRGAEWFLVAGLTAAVFIDSSTRNFEQLLPHEWLPLASSALFEVFAAWRDPEHRSHDDCRHQCDYSNHSVARKLVHGLVRRAPMASVGRAP
ncbi:MAG: hypothetical protein U1D30_05430 [Planctomycetota bacterium]